MRGRRTGAARFSTLAARPARVDASPLAQRTLAVPLAAKALALLAAAGSLACLPSVAQGQATFPDPPPPGIYHVDEASVLRPAEAAEIDRIADALLQDRDVALVVVTLPSLASRRAAGYTIERYATELFDRWGIGSQQHNYGILLLVSVGDRAARIELGAGYGNRYDAASVRIMEELIVPEFRAARYPEGALAGVRGLDAMARGLPLPSAPVPWYFFPIVFAVFAAATALAYSLFQSGRHGWAWAVVAALVALLLLLLRFLGQGGSGAGGGGSRGGGAFRGGSSGGGGATGRW